MEHDPLRCVHRDRVGMRDRMGDRHELDPERPDVDPITIGDRDELTAPEETGLLDAVAGETERQPRAEDRQGRRPHVADPMLITQQELDASDMVLVPVGRDESSDLIGVLA